MDPDKTEVVIRRDAQEDGPELRCPRCGHEEIHTRMTPDRFVYGEEPEAVELVARVPVRTCASCGMKFLDGAAEDAQHEAVCRHLGVLTPSEIRALRERHGLSRVAFARLTRLGEATLGRWERGVLIQNGAYDQFLRLLAYEENVRRLTDQSRAPVAEPLPAAQRSRSEGARQS